MNNLVKWLTKNNYQYQTNKLCNGGECVFVTIYQMSKEVESKLYKHLKIVKLPFQYAGHYTSIRIDFETEELKCQ